ASGSLGPGLRRRDRQPAAVYGPAQAEIGTRSRKATLAPYRAWHGLSVSARRRPRRQLAPDDTPADPATVALADCDDDRDDDRDDHDGRHHKSNGPAGSSFGCLAGPGLVRPRAGRSPALGIIAVLARGEGLELRRARRGVGRSAKLPSRLRQITSCIPVV